MYNIEGIYNLAKPCDLGHHEHERDNISSGHSTSSSHESSNQTLYTNETNVHITNYLLNSGAADCFVQVILHNRKK